MRIDFVEKDAAEYWRVINDNVMGGRSLGGLTFENNTMVFAGSINTNGGGFSSVRARIETGSLADTKALILRLKPDGRSYKVSLRTNALYRGRSVAFQALIPASEAGQWATVKIPYTDFTASLFGRPLSGTEFNKSEAQSIGFIIADDQDGPFRLDVEWIESC